MAGCKEDLLQNSAYINCLMGFSNYIQNNMDDPTKMIEVMCSEEAKTKVQCLLGYAKQCPEAMGADGSDGMGGMLQQIGNLDDMCSMFSGPCTQVKQCIDANSDFPEDPDMDSGSTPIYKVQHVIKVLCGPTKNRLDCLEDHRDQCPDLVARIETELQNLLGNNERNTAILNFIKQDCPKVPKTLPTNTCVKNKLGSSEFEQCYAKVAEMYPSQQQMKSCPAYLAGKKCVDDNVGQCGATEADVVVKVANLIVGGMPSNCQQQQDGKNVGSGTAASLTVHLALIAVCIAVLRN